MADLKNLKKFDALCDELQSLQLTATERKQLHNDLQKLLDDVIEKEKKMMAKVLDENQKNWDRQFSQVPEYCLNLTLGQIEAAGGSVTCDGVSKITVEVSLQLIRDNVSSVNPPPTGLNTPRSLKGMKSIVLDSAERGYYTMRNRQESSSTHPMTRRKIVHPPKRFDSSLIENQSSICNTAKRFKKPVATVTTKSTVKKVRSSKAVAAATKILVQSQQLQSKATPRKIVQDDRSEKCISTDIEGHRLSEVNPRTPGGENRLFSKNPRPAKPGEIIVHVSKKGTPLIVESSNKQANKVTSNK